MKRQVEKLVAGLEKRVKELGCNNWEYHQRVFEQSDIEKDDVLTNNLDVGYEDWEDIAFIDGEITELEEVIFQLKKLISKKQ